MFFAAQREYKEFKYNIKGFSVLDLLVSMSIVAIMACVAIPNMIHGSDMQLDYEAIKMVNKIRDVQSQAITRRSGDSAFSSVVSMEMDYIYTTYDSYETMHAGDSKQFTYFPNGIYTRSGVRYNFNNDGAGSFKTIVLRDENRMIQVIIDIAGRIRIEK